MLSVVLWAIGSSGGLCRSRSGRSASGGSVDTACTKPVATYRRRRRIASLFPGTTGDRGEWLRLSSSPTELPMGSESDGRRERKRMRVAYAYLIVHIYIDRWSQALLPLYSRVSRAGQRRVAAHWPTGEPEWLNG